jgi:hypothetical protein
MQRVNVKTQKELIKIYSALSLILFIAEKRRKRHCQTISEINVFVLIRPFKYWLANIF